MMDDISLENLKARRVWSNTFRGLKKRDYEPRIIYPVKLSAIVGERKTFHDINSLRNYIHLTQPKENSGSNISI